MADGLSLAGAGDTEEFGRRIADLVRAGDVIGLSGPLGGGKTTLARGLLTGLGLQTEAPSPSFGLVIAYDLPDVRLPVWHVDLYRIEDVGEIAELGLDDALSYAALLIEWPERMGSRFWPDALALLLAPQADGGRRLTWEVPAAWESRWPPPRS